MPLLKKDSNKWTIFIPLIAISIFLVFIIPEIISFFLFNRENSIAFISYGKNFILYFISLMIIIIVLLSTHYFKRVFIKILVSLLGFVIIIYVNFVGIQYSIYFDEDFIVYKPLFGTSESYEWSKFSKVYHELPTEEYVEKYIFEFHDGETFELIITSNFSNEITTKIEDKIMTLEASYEEY
ncbi:hypothetical protein ACOQFO_10960 [Ureibacillus sp. MALMAid1270]|uniref:hypothetical protein n=1 Tax=Ureibacillus sp. MALMAid1270 TaxID=3411629 RepID=UPI003BA4010F